MAVSEAGQVYTWGRGTQVRNFASRFVLQHVITSQYGALNHVLVLTAVEAISRLKEQLELEICFQGCQYLPPAVVIHRACPCMPSWRGLEAAPAVPGLTLNHDAQGQLGHASAAIPRYRDEALPRRLRSLEGHKMEHVAAGRSFTGAPHQPKPFSDSWD